MVQPYTNAGSEGGDSRDHLDGYDAAILRFLHDDRDPVVVDDTLTVLCKPEGAHRVPVDSDSLQPASCPACEPSEPSAPFDPHHWRCHCGRKGYDEVIAMQFMHENPDYPTTHHFEPERDRSYRFDAAPFDFSRSEDHGPGGCFDLRTGWPIPPVEPELALFPDEKEAGVAVQKQIREGTIRMVAERRVLELTATRDQRLDAIHVATGLHFLVETDEPAAPLLGGLAAQGHNVTLTAAYKVGKTTTLGHTARALLTAQPFLSRFNVDRAYRVAWLNWELTKEDQRDLIRTLNLPPDALQRLLVLNLRGTRLCITSPAGRDWLVAQLLAHRAEVMLVDTYGAAMAQSVESENDNAGARRFLATIDEIKGLADCRSSVLTCHTGRRTHDEGAEHARGATVLDDWADVRMVLTKDPKSENRFLATEGRARYHLPESALRYDPATGSLWLPQESIGTNRAEARDNRAVDDVATIVRTRPGIDATDLRDAIKIGNHQASASAVNKAKKAGRVHTHRDGRHTRYYPGQAHPASSRCPA